MWRQTTFSYNNNIRTSWEQELFYSKLYPPNSTVEWVDTDKPKDAIYEKDIKYTFNEYGFRSDDFAETSDINIMTCGCSHTVGVGVDQHEAWPFVLKDMVKAHTGKTVSIHNLATSGASPDYVVRSTAKTIKILKPDFVCVFWPPITRLEIPYEMDDRNFTQTFVKNSDFPKSFVSEPWLQDYAYVKNSVLLDAITEVNGAKLIANTVIESIVENMEGDYFPADSTGRDGMHPGPNWHKTGAEFYFNNIKKHL